MDQVIECVMNVSEGRDAGLLNRISAEAGSIEGAFLLSTSADRDHNRAVLTVAGAPMPVLEAAMAASAEAVAGIDLNHHRGVHPRIGAVDVVPFVPLKGMSMGECRGLSIEFAQRFAARFEIPVYLYQEAAVSQARRELAHLRIGGFEGLRAEIEHDSERWPDFGLPRLHPTAGATVVGARELLVAFNIYLDTQNVSVARQIARTVRESSGGLRGVKALGFYLEHRGMVQVSTNVTRLDETSPGDVLDAVWLEAERIGVRVVSTEVIGHLPRMALAGRTLQDLLVENARIAVILEERFAELSGFRL